MNLPQVCSSRSSRMPYQRRGSTLPLSVDTLTVITPEPVPSSAVPVIIITGGCKHQPVRRLVIRRQGATMSVLNNISSLKRTGNIFCRVLNHVHGLRAVPGSQSPGLLVAISLPWFSIKHPSLLTCISATPAPSSLAVRERRNGQRVCLRLPPFITSEPPGGVASRSMASLHAVEMLPACL
jgi:hypothetical protein